ncbi:hypothetical protein [Altericista sp. CCNU0014]|uniref:hypothetical protein n=1 Tax=Altericista sp. CCNU0014 TaxID=3082949 RepID=UPI00384B1A67
MNSFASKSLSLGLATLFLAVSTAAQASPIVRGKVRGYNPTTGNSGSAVGGYNANTGARSYRVRGYNPSTQTYKGASGAYNPVTGRGYRSTGTYNPSTGYSGDIQTNNNGSYVCTASRSTDPNCVKQ